MSIQLPDFVRIVVDDLSIDEANHSIWLVGSRANGYESVDSDWDILYFSDNEPIAREQRDCRVDMIHIGPSGNGLAGGKGIEFLFSFKNWEWKEINNEEATYTGRKFVEYPDGVRDASDPVYELRKNRAYCLWRRS